MDSWIVGKVVKAKGKENKAYLAEKVKITLC